MSQRRTNLLALTQRMSPFAQGKYPVPTFIEAPKAVVWGNARSPMSYGDGGAWFTAPITSGYVQRGGYSGLDVKTRRPSARRVAHTYGFQPSAFSSDRSPAVPAGPSITPRPPVVHDPSFGGFGAAKVSADQVETAVRTTGQVAEFLASIFSSRRARREAEAVQQQVLLAQIQAEQAQQTLAAQGAPAPIWPWILGGAVVVLGAGAGAYFLLRRK